mmetsp:Transcript_4315/g.6895  ORF Transcript_4315/g.6895 Transcript_4315/m.6895 type:complete len:616 (+) Transcript_4315:1064-2911(+)
MRTGSKRAKRTIGAREMSRAHRIPSAPWVVPFQTSKREILKILENDVNAKMRKCITCEAHLLPFYHFKMTYNYTYNGSVGYSVSRSMDGNEINSLNKTYSSLHHEDHQQSSSSEISKRKVGLLQKIIENNLPTWLAAIPLAMLSSGGAATLVHRAAVNDVVKKTTMDWYTCYGIRDRVAVSDSSSTVDDGGSGDSTIIRTRVFAGFQYPRFLVDCLFIDHDTSKYPAMPLVEFSKHRPVSPSSSVSSLNIGPELPLHRVHMHPFEMKPSFAFKAFVHETEKVYAEIVKHALTYLRSRPDMKFWGRRLTDAVNPRELGVPDEFKVTKLQFEPSDLKLDDRGVLLFPVWVVRFQGLAGQDERTALINGVTGKVAMKGMAHHLGWQKFAFTSGGTVLLASASLMSLYNLLDQAPMYLVSSGLVFGAIGGFLGYRLASLYQNERQAFWNQEERRHAMNAMRNANTDRDQHWQTEIRRVLDLAVASSGQKSVDDQWRMWFKSIHPDQHQTGEQSIKKDITGQPDSPSLSFILNDWRNLRLPYEILGLPEPPPDPSKDEILEAFRMQAMLWNPANYDSLTTFENQELAERYALIRFAERSLMANYMRKKKLEDRRRSWWQR